jgi:hypothetical protein
MSDTYFSPVASVCNSRAMVTMQRRYDTDGAPWRVMLFGGDMKASAERGATCFPMAAGVINDFGTLTLTEAWQ